jgi:hypothetical protein
MKVSNSSPQKYQMWFSSLDRQRKVVDIGTRAETIFGLLIGACDIQVTCFDQRNG